MKSIHIVSRKSPLALRQTHIVAEALLALQPDLHIEVSGITTSGDERGIGLAGKSDFTKELQQMLLASQADIAVHSMKDVAVVLPEGLQIGAILQRDNPYDALLSKNFSSLGQLPDQAIVGTASLRRRCQLRHLRPDLRLTDLRGNIGTRMDKLDNGEYDAIVLAAAGLQRMQMDDRITEILSAPQMMPAIAQGAIGIETTENCHADLQKLLHRLNHEQTALCVQTERAVGRLLNADCRLPVAAHAVIDGGQIRLGAMVGDSDTAQLISAEDSGNSNQAEALAVKVVASLHQQGAEAILQKQRQ